MQPEEVDPSATCCMNCKWFENRSGFCRYNPPSVIPVYVKDIGQIINSAFPKISMPHIDWCRCFESK